MKISRPEAATVLMAAVFLAFSAGWFLGGRSGARPVRVETERVLVQETPLALPAPAPAGEKVNINTAGLEELITLPGIGESRARAILDEREANGPFRIPEELTRVSGIVESTMQGLLPYITVS